MKSKRHTTNASQNRPHPVYNQEDGLKLDAKRILGFELGLLDVTLTGYVYNEEKCHHHREADDHTMQTHNNGMTSSVIKDFVAGPSDAEPPFRGLKDFFEHDLPGCSTENRNPAMFADLSSRQVNDAMPQHQASVGTTPRTGEYAFRVLMARRLESSPARSGGHGSGRSATP